MRPSSDWIATLPEGRLMAETVVTRSPAFEAEGLASSATGGTTRGLA